MDIGVIIIDKNLINFLDNRQPEWNWKQWENLSEDNARDG